MAENEEIIDDGLTVEMKESDFADIALAEETDDSQFQEGGDQAPAEVQTGVEGAELQPPSSQAQPPSSETQVQPPATQPPVQTPVAQPVVVPPVAQPQPVAAPVQAPPPTPEPVQQPPAAVPEEPLPDPKVWLEKKKELAEQISKGYQLSPEDEENWVSEPNKVLPKIAAQLYVDVYEAVTVMVTRNLAQQLPSLMQGQMSQQRNAEEGIKAFVEEWPGLNKPEYAEVLTRVAQNYPRLNPKATRDQAVKEIGTMVAGLLGVPPETLRKGYNPVQPPAAPVPVQQPSRPFVPAGVGGPAAAPSAPGPSNIFTELAFLDEVSED